MRCPSCNVDNPGAAKFCLECGAALRAQAASPARAADSPSLLPAVASDGERRLLTVAFCDLVGSTDLSSRLDPEDLHEVIRAYQKECASVIEQFGGHIAQYLGDGILMYFGYPVAQEGAAERAVRSGLGIIEAIRKLNPRLKRECGVEVELRLGMHTGIVVTGQVGSGAAGGTLALGDVPNIAARVQAQAEAGTVLISDATYRLIRGYFDCTDLGLHELKGVPEPMRLHQVLREGTTRSRLDIVAPGALTPLVGREPQLAMLIECWNQVQDGHGQALLLSGEAGIGKSRLARALAEHVSGDPEAQLIPLQCSPYYQNTAFHPVYDLLAQVLLRLERTDTPQERLDKLEHYLDHDARGLRDVAPLLAALLSLPVGDRYPALNLPPERQKQRTTEALVRLLTHQANQRPTLLLVDDLQWADPSSLDLLGLIVERMREAKLLVLLTSRPGHRPAWADNARVSELTIERLHPHRVLGIIESLAGGKQLPREVVDQILAKTDGVPLFVEELTKLVLESGLLHASNGRYDLAGPLPAFAIPTTLHESLMARLDRLDQVKVVAQVGATIGREFVYQLLRAVVALDEAELRTGLDRLVTAGLLFQRGSPPDASFTFKHALVQDAAYASLLRRTRRHFHQRIAEVLVEEFSELCAAQPELLAHHYMGAGLHDRAAPLWLAAGQRALERSANVEAIGHLNRGLELLEQQPSTPDRMQQELACQVMLGTALMATRGYGDASVGLTWNRARQLCHELGDPPQLAPVLFGLWTFYVVRAQHRTAQEIAANLERIASETDDPDLRVEAPLAMGWSCFLRGQFADARERLELVLNAFKAGQHGNHAVLYGTEPRVSALACLAETLWFLGYPEQAVARSKESVALSSEANHHHSSAHALAIAGYLHAYREEPDTILEREEAALRLCREQGLTYFETIARILHDWALLSYARQTGDLPGTVAKLHEDITLYERTGAGLSRPLWLGLLALGCEYAGQVDEALEHVASALTVVEESDERFWEAELHRVRGELLLKKDSDAAPLAEECFNTAIAIARRQGALSLELRAAMSLARLWQQHGRKAEGAVLLASVISTFTEGLDSSSVQAARVLLGTLAADDSAAEEMRGVILPGV